MQHYFFSVEQLQHWTFIRGAQDGLRLVLIFKIEFSSPRGIGHQSDLLLPLAINGEKSIARGVVGHIAAALIPVSVVN